MSIKLSDAIKTVNRALITCGSLGALSMVSVPAFAQDQASEIEEVQVLGIRGALQSAIENKRNSTAVIDSITAEDVGKFPDNNVAESLGRIPGVAVSRQFGGGDAVSIRGASNQLTLTTLNGQSVASTGWYTQQPIDRTFNYAMLPPEMISGIDVYKSSQADLVEGGVGGTVNVKTRKPLDLEAHTVRGSIKGTYSDQSEEWDPAISGLYSFKNDSETFGILASVAQADYTLTRRGDEALPAWGGRIAPTHFHQERQRTAFDVTAQFRPSEQLEFGAHYMNLELTADNVNSAAWIPQDLNNCEFNDQGAPIKCTASNGSAGNTYWDVRPRNATMTSETFDLNMEYSGENFLFTAQVGTTKAEGGTDFETNFGYLSIQKAGITDGTIDSTGDTVKYDLTDPNFGPGDLPGAGEYGGWEGLQTGAVVQQPNTDEEVYFQADIAFDVDFGAVKTIKTGVRTTQHEVMQTKYNGEFAGYDGAAESLVVDGSRFANGTIEAGHGVTIPKPNASEMIAYTNSKLTGWILDRSGYSTIEEDNFAAYVMAEIETESLRGNFGLRYISTDAATQFYAPIPSGGYETELSKDTAGYRDVLPSITLATDLSEEMVLRFSAAQVMARANYNDMFGNSALAGYNDTIPGNERVIKGNVGLKPYKANQADIALEYYYGEGNLASIAYYTKSVTSFTTADVQLDQQIGLVDPDSGVDSWTVESLTVGDGGYIDGIELQLQHAFDNGFGAIANYTYADAAADASNFSDGNGVFTDSSKHYMNLVGYYENDTFSARVAYNWRSAYMIRETGFYGAREHQDFGTVDLSFAYQVTDLLGLTAEVTNLFGEDSVQIGRDKGDATYQRTSYGYPAYNYLGETRMTVGANLSF
ncbi:TonB-dependent receptor [Simiduia sp. 21SJ11W-1]|uniref:TonB-dependent receptor n=1 Tax=Simiduia sp. 21SJ11W-1 TaxID=2909669 RepID=UPI00209F9143|nr:TonB-dependent receptor [Simiduia sp. 21SJ11W-1]UTA46610.1 TonB-dependent receptor [Simiduia sp. 21SJ11W-1]